MNDYTLAFLLTVLAGLSMLIGSGITVLTKLTNQKFLSVSLGFSAGVMIYLSMMEILPEAREYLDNASGELRGGIFTLAAFFGGILLMWFLEAVIAPHGHDHGCGFHGSSHGQSIHDPSKLMRIGHRYCSGYPQFSGRSDHLCIRTAGNENRNPCRCCHHHPQHPCGDFHILTHLSRDRIPHEGYKILLFIRTCRACRRPRRLADFSTIYERSGLRIFIRRGRRGHDFHVLRRAASFRQRIRKSQIFHLWPGAGHGCHGCQPSDAVTLYSCHENHSTHDRADKPAGYRDEIFLCKFAR